MPAVSFYAGPGQPLLVLRTWQDLVAAAQVGALAETQWVELKAALPPAASKANLELARDLASLSVEGGALVIGVRDPGDTADHVVGTDDPLEGLKSRVDQVAAARVHPPLHVQLTALARPGDPGRNVLVVAVPASAAGPHMVDERYWGRSATGKRPLTDDEASRLLAGRRDARQDFTDRLTSAPEELERLWPAPRTLGWAQILLEPAAASLAPRLSEAVQGALPVQLVREAGIFQAQWSPGLDALRYPVPHPDGLAAAAAPTGEPLLEHQAWQRHALLRDSGALRVLSPALQPVGTGAGGTQDIGISVNRLMEQVHQSLLLAGHLGHAYLRYAGQWNVGIHLEGLAGQVSAQALVNSFGASARVPFQIDRYSRSTSAVTARLLEQPGAVVAELLQDLARGLDLQQRLFPYTDPAQIYDRR